MDDLNVYRNKLFLSYNQYNKRQWKGFEIGFSIEIISFSHVEEKLNINYSEISSMVK